MCERSKIKQLNFSYSYNFKNITFFYWPLVWYVLFCLIPGWIQNFKKSSYSASVFSSIRTRKFDQYYILKKFRFLTSNVKSQQSKNEKKKCFILFYPKSSLCSNDVVMPSAYNLCCSRRCRYINVGTNRTS